MTNWKFDKKAEFIDWHEWWSQRGWELKRSQEMGHQRRGEKGRNSENRMKGWTLASLPFTRWPPVLCTQQEYYLCACVLSRMWFQSVWILTWRSVCAHPLLTLWLTFLRVRYVWACGPEAEAPAAESSVMGRPAKRSQAELSRWEVTRGDFWDSSQTFRLLLSRECANEWPCEFKCRCWPSLKYPNYRISKASESSHVCEQSGCLGCYMWPNLKML